MTYISAYLVNLVNLANLDGLKDEERKKYQEDIKRFVLNLPKGYPVSLKAAIALARWLVQKDGEMNPEGEQSETNKDAEWAKNNLDQLFRSFSFIEVFKENGTEVFHQLRMDRSFRLFDSVMRGKLLAYLLHLYEPIIKIKEECAFHLEDQMGSDGKRLHLVHYTKLRTLELLLATDYDHSFEPLKLQKAEDEPQFRLSNCGYMNDIKEGHTMLACMEKVIKQNDVLKSKESNGNKEFWDMVSAYFPDQRPSGERRYPNGSNIYLGCLSVKPDSFSMGTVYSENETGCTVEFEDGFFDVRGVAYRPKVLRDYLPPFFTDQEYPLYNVNYIGQGFDKVCADLGNQNPEKHDGAYNIQNCHTRSIWYDELCAQLSEIYERWAQLDKKLNEIINDASSHSSNQYESEYSSPGQTVRRFVADRLNEIRFLFKSSDYEFESEVRVVYIDSNVPLKAKTDRNISVPLVYVDVERDIKNITVTLGSHIEDAKVNRIVAWLNHTGRVKEVKLAQRNRPFGEG